MDSFLQTQWIVPEAHSFPKAKPVKTVHLDEQITSKQTLTSHPLGRKKCFPSGPAR